MKKLFLIFTAAAAFTSCRQAEEKIVDTFIKQAANEANKSMPQMLDAETRMDSLAPGGPKTLAYYYTLVNLSKDDFDTTLVDQIIKPPAVAMIKKEEKLKQARKYGVIFRYIYMDKNGKYAASINVTPEDYEEKKSY